MQIKIKPLTIKLSYQRGGLIRVETPHAFIEVTQQQLGYTTQGLAYDPKKFELSGPKNLQSLFRANLDAQLCLSHLSATVSPFLRNYITNKATKRDNLFSFDSLMSSLTNQQRILFCGAGPSLYESWEFVEFCLNTGYATVVAGGSAIKAFESECLIPDICLVCDPNPGVATRSDLSKGFMASTVLLAGSGVHPGLLNKWSGPKVLTNGMSALKVGDYLEPNTTKISEGGIGVSTFAMNLANNIVGCQELMLLGIDLSPTADNKVYPDHLGFDGAIDVNRGNIWQCEAQALGNAAGQSNVTVTNLATKGRDIPNTTKVDSTTIERPLSSNPLRFNLIKADTEEFRSKLEDFFSDLCSLDLNNVVTNPIFKPFIEIYHTVLLSRVLYTGEYAKESLLLKLEHLKLMIEQQLGE